jgi:predicted DCC family thiol-disulfide oxidoreductase YuxK
MTSTFCFTRAEYNRVVEKKIEVSYDRVCKMCEGAMSKMAASEQGGKFVRVDVTTGMLPPGRSINDALRNMHVVDADGLIYEGVDGIFRIMDEYPHLKLLSRIGRLPGLHLLSRGVYRLIAAHRRRFNSLIK